MKTIKELKADLAYYQTMNRVDVRSLREGIRKCKEIGEQLRKLQKEKKVKL